MPALARRIGPHVGLVAARTVTVVLFTVAGVIVGDVSLSFFAAVLLGVGVGVTAGLVADRAAVEYGRRVGRTEMQDHYARQAAARARTTRIDNARRNVSRVPGSGKTNLLAAILAEGSTAESARPVSERLAMHRLAEPHTGGSRLVTVPGLCGTGGTVPGVDTDTETHQGALQELQRLVNETLQPYELVGQQGRGVIQLAAELGPQVPSLDAETVTAYIGDHVLAAAGLPADRASWWPEGLLEGVRRLRTPQGQPPLDGVVLERVDGLDLAFSAAGGSNDLPRLLDVVVDVIAGSGRVDGLRIAQIGVLLGAQGYRVGPYTLAAALARLVRSGRLDRVFGEAQYRVSDRELRRRAEGAEPAEVVSRPGLLRHIMAAVTGAGDDGLDIEGITAAVNAQPGFDDAEPLHVLDGTRTLVSVGELVQAPSGNYQPAPF